jgi:hypothetical protein
MSALVKANASLTAGNLAVLRRSFVTTDDGSIRYAVDYCCLEQYAPKWTPFFRTRATPPTSLPVEMLQLNLTKTPELYDLTLETMNGLTYFKAVYSAGVSTEVIITEDSDVRNFTVTTTRDVGYNFRQNGAVYFQKTGEETITDSFDYVSVTVTAQSKNTRLPTVQGRITALDGSNVNYFVSGGAIVLPTLKLINKSSTTRSSRGEYTYNLSSSGIIDNITREGMARTVEP